jgi:spore germination protein YaaH
VREAAGWDTGAYDWQALGQAVDAIELVSEPDQSLYYQRMEEALDFLTQQVDGSKLMLVMSPFSHEKGGEGIKALLLSQALGLASTLVARTEGDIRPEDQVTIVGPNIYQEEGASGLFWDDEALAVTFSYPGEGGARTVWIENGFSVAFKLDLVRRFQLGGVAVEDVSLSAAGPNIWGPIQELAESGKVTLVKPNGSLLKPYWEASEGALDGGAKGAVVWTAPAPGTYEVTLVVSDGVVRAGQRLSLEVKAGE